MRLLEIHAQNFGVFRDRHFDLGQDGFVLVSGPNEAGKSTLLQLVREVLFGFPHSSSYAVDGPMQAEAIASLRDGSRLTFRRRKGRKDVIEGRIDPGGATVDEARLTHLLGHTRAALYQNVFAFSLTELGDGASSFQRAELTLTEALFGGSIGGLAHLPRVKRQLREEYESLFKEAGKKPPINELVRVIKEEKKRLKEVAVKPARYQELKGQRDDLLKQIEAHEALYKTRALELAHLQRLSKGWEHYRAAEQVRQQLQSLTVPDSLRPGDAQRCDTLDATLVELEAQLQGLTDALATLVHQQQGLVCEPQFVAEAANIKRLEHEIGKIEGFLRDLPEREKELAAAESRIAGVLKGLHPDWTIQKLSSLRLSLDQRTRVRELVERMRTLATQRQSLAEELETLTPVVERQRTRLASFAEDESHEAIPAALVDESKFSAERSVVRQAEKRIAQATTELAQLYTRLQAQLPEIPAELSRLEPPLVAAVEEFRDEMAALDRQVATLRDRLDNTASALRGVQEELLGLEQTGAIPDKGILDSARQRRDAGWRLIRRHYVEGQNCEKRIAEWLADPLHSLPEEYVRAVDETDRLADERQQKADGVAKKEHLLSQQTLMSERVEQFTRELELLSAQQAAATARWHKLWQPCGLAPQSPAVMLQWLQVFGVWQQKAAELQEAQQTREHALQFCTAFEERLRIACGDATSVIDRLVHQARERTASAKQMRGQRQELERSLEENDQRLSFLGQQQARLQAEETAWQQQWKALLKELGLPVDWQVTAIEQLLIACEQALSDERVAQDLRHRVGDMNAERQQFDDASHALAEALASELASLPIVERVRQLAARAQAAQEAETRMAGLSGEVSRLQLEMRNKQERRKTVEGERAELWRQVGAVDGGSFRQLTQDAVRRDRLLDDLRAAERALSVAREHEEEALFFKALAELDHDQLRTQQAGLEGTLHTLTNEMNAMREESGKRQQELDQLHQEGDALLVQQSIENHRGQLREHVERWTSLVLAEKMLEGALVEFQREHQDDVLAEARRLFAQLTGGKHIDIRHGVGDNFWVVDADGQQRSPEELSRGAREQLYLAFRLAYVKHYCRDREPLPFVMDDVLVNFDPERASATIEALLELSQHVQIIFLTCHPTTVEMVKEHHPGCTHVELGDRLVGAS